MSLLRPSSDLRLLFFAAPGFAGFANQRIRDALIEHALAEPTMKDTIEIIGTLEKPSFRGGEDGHVDALRWSINSVLGWQQIDRRIDE